MIVLGETIFVAGVITGIEFRDKQNIVTLKLKHYESNGEVKEKNLDINKEIFDEKLENISLDCLCFVGIKRYNLRTVEKFDEEFDSSNYDKLSARAWNQYRKAHLKGYNRYLRDDVIFIKQITDENGETVENSFAANENIDMDYIDSLQKVFTRLSSDSIKSISRTRI